MTTTHSSPLLILASTSTARKRALKQLLLPFNTMAPQVDETQWPNEPVKDMVIRLATMKARAVANDCPRALVIGGDQVATIEDTIFGKPKNQAEAVKQLKQSSGQTVSFHHGLCLLNTQTGGVQTAIESTRVTFRSLTQDHINNYLALEKPYHCAGSLMAERLGIALVERIESRDPQALFGLPLIHLVSMLENEGLDVLSMQCRSSRSNSLLS